MAGADARPAVWSLIAAGSCGASRSGTAPRLVAGERGRGREGIAPGAWQQARAARRGLCAHRQPAAAWQQLAAARVLDPDCRQMSSGSGGRILIAASLRGQTRCSVLGQQQCAEQGRRSAARRQSSCAAAVALVRAWCGLVWSGLVWILRRADDATLGALWAEGSAHRTLGGCANVRWARWCRCAWGNVWFSDVRARAVCSHESV